jgi:hypothetical protein
MAMNKSAANTPIVVGEVNLFPEKQFLVWNALKTMLPAYPGVIE